MAVKWAVANGNWNAGATWNGGVVPAIGDEVYLNGHTVTTTNLIFHGRVNNGSNQDYGITEGGVLDCYNYNSAANITIDELDCYIKGIISIRKNYYYSGNQNRFIGNINNYSVGGVFTGRFSGYLIIIGNAHLHTNTAKIIDDGSDEVANPLEITGNITAVSGAELQRNNTTTTIIGSCEATIRATNLNFNGIAKMKMGNSLIATTLTINGLITYKSTNNTMGVRYTTLNILNPDTFTWKDVTEPRSNPFIILTDAEMNNRQQYPSEDEVKEGTEYVWGEKIGTYQQPPESVVLKDYEYDTIIAEENDIATYNAVRYIYADYGTLHWFELKTTTTDIVTDPTSQSIDIDGDTVVADTDYVVEYNDVCYQWSGSAWGSITTNNIGTIKTDIATNPTETTLCTKKGTLETTNISQQLISRLENCATVETVQQLLVAHLDN